MEIHLPKSHWYQTKKSQSDTSVPHALSDLGTCLAEALAKAGDYPLARHKNGEVSPQAGCKQLPSADIGVGSSKMLDLDNYFFSNSNRIGTLTRDSTGILPTRAGLNFHFFNVFRAESSKIR